MPAPVSLFYTRDIQTPPVDAGGNQAGLRGDLAAVPEADEVIALIGAERGCPPGEKFDVEAHRLLVGALGQLRAAEAGGKAQVVLDA